MIYIGSDHGGFSLKSQIIKKFSEYKMLDIGTYSDDSVDYPDIANKLCKLIKNDDDIGILICGTGIGMSMAANRFKHIRCGLCHNKITSEMTRKHNNANVLALGARVITTETAFEIVDFFFRTEFEGGRHLLRIKKL